uniref:NADH-ubiquinone oxidoreductase chain 3 n=1 Tax=Truljalia hibinonis TaxID=1982313 RepID=A0A1W6QZK7_9ORTH|nr:NADH dehydrogenase subunit 3 [Truljalia hibinonis]ARO46894.1 NADH dehydrogenase subunit 3 [Truljalia hibinonis]
MNLMISIIIIIMIITNFMLSISMILSKKSINDREKMSPFECGFDPNSSARMPFSLRFFLIALIFLIFDVEITLIMPIIITKYFSFPSSWIPTLLLFMTILLLGLYHEWNQGALDWMK